MSKLTKIQAKAHAEAEAILTKDRLSDDERLFVIENWQESARHINSIAGAFFTPWGLARDFAIETAHGRIIDLCAGIGALSLATMWYHARRATEIVCVEANPDYAAAGRKLLPEARWVVGDVFDLPADLGHFDCAISNPPFGNIKRTRSAPRYSGRAFELHVIDIASDIADWGAFIIPQQSAPFRFSGCPAGGWPATRQNGVGSGFEVVSSDLTDKFSSLTAISLGPGCGIDTAFYRNDWRGASPLCEVVTCDFEEARLARQPAPAVAVTSAAEPEAEAVQPDLFGIAA